tara:strand:- start:10849 stop:11124 length:276 start_codon:yes stop_codon:yes gene_type:complete
MNRQQRRELEKEQKKQEVSNHKLSNQIAQFNKLPDECLACETPFDKKSKKMAMTWNVVVKDNDTVRLYCPKCWSMARKVATEYIKEKQNAS